MNDKTETQKVDVSIYQCRASGNWLMEINGEIRGIWPANRIGEQLARNALDRVGGAA